MNSSPTDRAARSLARKRALSRAALRWERLWPAIWPTLGLLGVYAALSLLNAPAWLPPSARALVLLATLIAAAVLLFRGLARHPSPTADEVDRRLERGSGVKHRPLAALQDRPAEPSPEADLLWSEHLRRLQAVTERLRVTKPHPGLPGRDPRALRGALVVALAAAIVIAGPEAGSRLARAVMPALPIAPPAVPAQLQAWITPPAYTGLPPRLLAPTASEAVLPAGSKITISVTGADTAPIAAQDGNTTPFEPLDATSFQAVTTHTRSGRLGVTLQGDKLADWALVVTPDLPPTATFVEPPGQGSANGRPTLQTRLPWRAEDDYGLASVQAELRLRDRPEAPPLVVPLALKPAVKSARAVATPDLTAHPWAGLPVTGRIVARDSPGQTGTSADAALTLPERAFQNPAAQAVIAIRRQLSLTADEPARSQARAALDGIAGQPEAFDGASSILLNLRSIATLLQRGRGVETVDEAQARMWALALSLEDGTLDRTSKALETARQNLREVLNAPETSKPEPENTEKQESSKTDENKPDDAKQAEIDRRTQELREAIQRQLDALNEQSTRENAAPPFDPGAPQMNGRELDRKAQQPQKSAREGRLPDAKQQLAELERLLEELQKARPETGEAREQRNAERRERGQQQQNAVQDMVKREGGMLDHPPPGGAPPAADKPGATPAGVPNVSAADKDGRTQKALRRALGELMQRYGELTGQVPSSLGEADLAMREAGEALRSGQDPSAAQQRAIEALQKGGRDMGQQVARQFGTGEPGEGEDGQGDDPGGQGQGDGPGNKDGQGLGQPGGKGDTPGPGRRRTARRDPLGRPAPTGVGGSESGDVHVPDEMEAARGRALQNELRRRGAERSRPQNELEYIERLLEAY